MRKQHADFSRRIDGRDGAKGALLFLKLRFVLVVAGAADRVEAQCIPDSINVAMLQEAITLFGGVTDTTSQQEALDQWVADVLALPEDTALAAQARQALIPLSVNLSDMDDDGWPLVADNCPSVSNADQADTDSNGVGNACQASQVPSISTYGMGLLSLALFVVVVADRKYKRGFGVMAE